MGYQITTENEDGIDIVEVLSPMEAVHLINKYRVAGDTVTYTGDPFADFAAMLDAE